MRGFPVTPPTTAAVTAHTENTGSIPKTVARPYPMATPEKITGKK